MAINKRILVTGFFLLSFLLPVRATAATFSEMYIFGDSLSDTGNVFDATGGQFPPSPPYFNGRFSNGLLWVEYLAGNLGLEIEPQNNFAFAGAGTGVVGQLVEEGVNLPVPGVLGQVNLFTNTIAASQPPNPNALYTIWAGSNEYIFGGLTDPTRPVTELSQAVESLATLGARNIMVVNLLGFESPITDHNSLLADTLAQLNQSLDSNVNITLVDVNSLFSQIVAQPAQFGFTNLTTPCLDRNTRTICNNPEEFFSWDGLHPTTAVHQLVGDFAYETLKSKQHESVPEPTSVLGLFALGTLGMTSLLKRHS
ncbi:MAG: SGNH/GDSL hydrolase family protein [Coleofasciculus sp. S288]|nr:SGNH/GDSL hydrolase family protein [Coleofasciculus sp. S288]